MFEITQVGVGGNAYLNAGNCSYCILFIEDLLDVSATATTAPAAAASRVLLLFKDVLASTSSSSSSTCQVVSDLFLTFIHACIVGKVWGGAEEE